MYMMVCAVFIYASTLRGTSHIFDSYIHTPVSILISTALSILPKFQHVNYFTLD
jgi:hypothetical protein